MSEYGNITAAMRTEHGKGAARRLRAKGLIPAVLYGQGKENLSLTIDPHLLNKAADPERKFNTLFRVTVERDGGSETIACLITDMQRDAIRDDILHVDFLRVDLEEQVSRKIPVRYFGRSVGVAKGGKLKTFRRVVRISSKPGEIPVELPVDVTPLDAGQYLRISDMSLDNTTFEDRADTPLAFVEAPKAKKDEEDDGKKGKK